MGKLLEFDASISDVKQINPLFSTCKVRVLYTGKNRNLSIITKDAVEKALPTLKNIPIVGEYSEEAQDFKGHGGKLDLDSFKYIHTTKPYGVVPESATYEWEQVKGKDGTTREYLTINGCYLWTGRYEEAYSVIENGKGQSMEIEVTDGHWDENEEAYRINSFVFSALCILGDEVEPAFEDASITAYSLDKESFKREFNQMLKELSLYNKGVNIMKLKELLEKYSTTMEELTEKGLNFNEVSEDELEEKIAETLGVEVKPDGQPSDESQDGQDDQSDDQNADQDNAGEDEDQEGDDEGEGTDEEADDVQSLQSRIEELENELNTANHKLATAESKIKNLTDELEDLRTFKLNTLKAEHESKVKKLFTDFQLTEEDVKDIDIHKFSIEEIEEKCYAILGRKLASNKKTFSKQKGAGIHLPLNNGEKQPDNEYKPYGDLFEKYGQ